MQNRKFKPTTPGIRHQIRIEKNLLCKNNSFLKIHTTRLKKTGGRSRQDGHITSWHRGGGTKTKAVTLNTCSFNTYCICVAVVYNSNKNSFIAVNFNILTKKFNFSLYTEKVTIGTILEYKNKLRNLNFGSTTILNEIPTGSIVNSIYNRNNFKNTYAKAAGTSCQIVQKSINNVKLKLPSGKIVNTTPSTIATLGVLSNQNYSLCFLGKAGKKRYKSRRPIVRGVAMNPVDHPHGGRTKGGRPSVSPWGKLTKGVPTRRKKYE